MDEECVHDDVIYDDVQELYRCQDCGETWPYDPTDDDGYVSPWDDGGGWD